MYEKCKYCKDCDQWLPLYNFSKNSRARDGLQNKCKECQSAYHTNWRTVQNREGYNNYMRNYFKQRREEDPQFRVISSLRSRLSNLISNNNHSNTLSTYLRCSDQFFFSWLQFQFDEYMNWNNFGTYWHVDHVKPVAMYNHDNEAAKYECWNWRNLRPLEASENKQKSDKVDYDLYEEQKWKACEFKRSLINYDELYKEENIGELMIPCKSCFNYKTKDNFSYLPKKFCSECLNKN